MRYGITSKYAKLALLNSRQMDFYRTTIVRRFLNDAALMYVGNWMDMCGVLWRQLCAGYLCPVKICTDHTGSAQIRLY